MVHEEEKFQIEENYFEVVTNFGIIEHIERPTSALGLKGCLIYG